MQQAGGMSAHAKFLLGCIVVLMVGITPLQSLAYRLGLYRQVSAEQVEAELRRGASYHSARCEPGTGGWSFICETVFVQPHTKAQQTFKLGIVSSWESPIMGMSKLPPGPTPTKDEFLAATRRR